MSGCPQWTCITEAEWQRIGPQSPGPVSPSGPRSPDPRPVLQIVTPGRPDILARVAAEMAQEIALEQAADAAAQRPPARVWPQRGLQALPPALDGAREPALVCYVARGARHCGQCQRWGVLHYSVITNACMVTGSTYRMGSQRHLLCPSCLSGLPHRMLF